LPPVATCCHLLPPVIGFVVAPFLNCELP